MIIAQTGIEGEPVGWLETGFGEATGHNPITDWPESHLIIRVWSA